MKPVLLIDFGSTYTKVTAADVDEGRLLGTANAYTTVQSDINNGLSDALSKLEKVTGKLDFCERYAASSAAGGLRMLASGLVPELTAEAAKCASLGAGAKVLKTYAFKLNEDDADEIKAINPDIFLLVGGTDGGNTDCILHNAHVLADIGGDFPVILASELISGIMMPTPSAVMAAMKLLAEGTDNSRGLGELVAVDVGGATTDVYSVANGMPTDPRTMLKGLPEPYIKRTVEGDIGMRYSIRGIVDAAGIKTIAELAGVSEVRAEEIISMFAANTDLLPTDDETERLDEALACMAVRTAVTRHAGRIEEAYSMMGTTYVQTGKDLRKVQKLVVTGGSLIHTTNTAKIASFALYDQKDPTSLRPLRADVLVDRKYIIAAMGLLSEKYPEQALSIMKQELCRA